ncbi:MAG: hypothetical protein COB12_01750 [Flavobacterium sp.]|nr:MAG: hypothetical protein COB12_01750 [Flavobacterium sp.]
MEKNKTGKYLKYAIGEIILVVIGILIALQINNWNEHRKFNELLKLYQENIIFELEQDLIHINELDSINKTRKSSIENYIDYYNSEKINSNILKAKGDSTQLQIAMFNTNSYSVQDLMTTGNIKLFPLDKKKAILKFKNSQDKYVFIQSKTLDLLTNKFEDFEKEIDLIFTNGYSNKEHIEVKNWAYDLNSTQFRKRNNYIITFLELYEYQINVLANIRKETIELRNILEKK